MEAGTYHEQYKDNMHQDGATSIFGQRVFPNMCTAQTTQVFRSGSLRKLPEALGLEATKSWYPHYFNIEEDLDYVGQILDLSYYGVDEMSGGERKEFLSWY